MIIALKNKKEKTIKIFDLFHIFRGSVVYSNYTKKEAVKDFKNR